MEGIIEEPTVCPDAGCGAKHLMKLLHNRSEFSNKQLIKMQVGCHGLLLKCPVCWKLLWVVLAALKNELLCCCVAMPADVKIVPGLAD